MKVFHPPNDKETEEIILGKILIDNSLYDVFLRNTLNQGILEAGRQSYFYYKPHRRLLHSMEECRKYEMMLDCLNIINIIPIGNAEERIQVRYAMDTALLKCESAKEDFPYYLRILKEKFARRRIIADVSGLIDTMYSDKDPGNTDAAMVSLTIQCITSTYRDEWVDIKTGKLIDIR